MRFTPVLNCSPRLAQSLVLVLVVGLASVFLSCTDSPSENVYSGPAFSVYRTSDAGTSWTYCDKLRGSAKDVVYTSNGVYYCLLQDSSSLTVSSDLGQTWSSESTKSTTALTALCANPYKELLIACSVDGMVQCKRTKTARWDSLSKLNAMPTVLRMSTGRPGWILAGMQDATIRLSKDTAHTWQTLQPTGAALGVADLCMDRSDSMLVVCCGDENCYISTDIGQSWHPQKVHPSSKVSKVMSLNSGRDILAVALTTESGTVYNDVYHSADGGETWSLQTRFVGLSSSDRINGLCQSLKYYLCFGSSGKIYSTPNLISPFTQLSSIGNHGAGSAVRAMCFTGLNSGMALVQE